MTLKSFYSALTLGLLVMSFGMALWICPQLFSTQQGWQNFVLIQDKTHVLIDQPLGDQRHYLHLRTQSDHHANITIHFPTQQALPHYLSIRLGNRLSMPISGSWSIVLLTPGDPPTHLGQLNFDKERPPSFTAFSPRADFKLPPLKHHTIRLLLTRLSPAQDPSTLSIIELGFSPKLPHPSRWALLYQAHYQVLFAIALLTLILLNLSQKHRPVTWLTVVTLFLLSISYFSSSLQANWNPWDFMDLRAFTAANPLASSPGGNLNYGLYLGSNFFHGQGLLYSGAAVDWARMPGYPLFTALACLITPDAHNLVDVALTTLLLEIISIGLCLAFFYWAAQKILPASLALLISSVFLLMRHQLPYIQVESLMPAISFFILGTSCLYLHASQEGCFFPPYRTHLALHIGFALWFLMRPDVLIGWALVSLCLYARKKSTLPYLLLPLSLFLLIGVSWALYKQPYTHEFSMTTNTVGEVFVNGLFANVPHHFIWDGSDASYFDWMQSVLPKVNPQGHVASSFALRETLRFYFIYPIYTFSVFWHNFINFVYGYATPGLDNGFRPTKVILMPLLTFIALSAVLRYRLQRLLLLGWPIYLNLPIYFLTFNSGGRFYFPAIVALLATGLPLVFEKKFYAAFWHSQRVIPKYGVILMALFIFHWGASVDNHLLDNHKLRYWSPFLDPQQSPLNRIKPGADSFTPSP